MSYLPAIFYSRRFRCFYCTPIFKYAATLRVGIYQECCHRHRDKFYISLTHLHISTREKPCGSHCVVQYLDPQGIISTILQKVVIFYNMVLIIYSWLTKVNIIPSFAYTSTLLLLLKQWVKRQ